MTSDLRNKLRDAVDDWVMGAKRGANGEDDINDLVNGLVAVLEPDRPTPAPAPPRWDGSFPLPDIDGHLDIRLAWNNVYTERFLKFIAIAANHGGLYEAFAEGVQAAYERIDPPRIREPGPYGVVIAACVHNRDHRRRWFRDGDTTSSTWIPTTGGGKYGANADDWDSLIEPELIRSGQGDDNG